MNAMTLAMAIELESTGIKVNACSPSFNLNAYEGAGTVEEGPLSRRASRCSDRMGRQAHSPARVR